jgi:hypothetical protein
VTAFAAFLFAATKHQALLVESETIRVRRAGKNRKAKHWSGRVPRTGVYTFAITAFPGSAHYTLQIKVER